MKSFDDTMKELFSDMGIMVDPVVVKAEPAEEVVYTMKGEVLEEEIPLHNSR